MEKDFHHITINLKSTDKQKNSADFYDLATTVLAFGQTVQAIANTQTITKGKNIRIEVEALKPGSLDIPTIITVEGMGIVKNIAIASLPLAPIAFSASKQLLSILVDIISVRKFLKGEKPKEVKIDQTGDKPKAIIINNNGGKMELNMNTFNAMQDKRVNRNVKKIYEPLTREESGLETITLVDKDKGVKEIPVEKSETIYFEDIQELQKIDKYKVRGVISRLDSKTLTGAITLGERRINFEVVVEPNEFVKSYLIIAESLKLQVPIYVTGKAILDYESNLKKIEINKVEQDVKLFDDLK